MNDRIKAIEIGVDNWQPEPNYWKELVKELALKEQEIGDGNYTAWNIARRIAITSIWRKEEEIGPHGNTAITIFAPITEKSLSILEKIKRISYFEGMDFGVYANSTLYNGHSEEILKLFRIKRKS